MPTITLIPQAAFGTVVRTVRIGPFNACLQKNLRVQRGPVHYEYVLAAIDRRIKKITFFITSERNTETVGGSHVLSMFIDDNHVNFGASDDWADLDKFEAASLKLVHQVIAREAHGPHASNN
jgi:hypothetical protein